VLFGPALFGPVLFGPARGSGRGAQQATAGNETSLGVTSRTVAEQAQGAQVHAEQHGPESSRVQPSAIDVRISVSACTFCIR
jgi:hypothetical protein